MGVPDGMGIVGSGVSVRVGIRVGVLVDVDEGEEVTVGDAVNVNVSVGVKVFGRNTDAALQAIPGRLLPRIRAMIASQVFFAAMFVFIVKIPPLDNHHGLPTFQGMKYSQPARQTKSASIRSSSAM
jgi:hypothetical protein